MGKKKRKKDPRGGGRKAEREKEARSIEEEEEEKRRTGRETGEKGREIKRAETRRGREAEARRCRQRTERKRERCCVLSKGGGGARRMPRWTEGRNSKIVENVHARHHQGGLDSAKTCFLGSISLYHRASAAEKQTRRPLFARSRARARTRRKSPARDALLSASVDAHLGN